MSVRHLHEVGVAQDLQELHRKVVEHIEATSRDGSRGRAPSVVGQGCRLVQVTVLIVGIDRYQWGYSPLANCVRDGKMFKEAIEGYVTKQKCMMRLKACRELYNEEATFEKIIEALADIEKTSHKDNTTVLYWAGHGRVARTLNTGFEEESLIPYNSGVDYALRDVTLTDLSAWGSRHLGTVYFLINSGTSCGNPTTRGQPPAISLTFPTLAHRITGLRGYHTVPTIHKPNQHWFIANDGADGHATPLLCALLRSLPSPPSTGAFMAAIQSCTTPRPVSCGFLSQTYLFSSKCICNSESQKWQLQFCEAVNNLDQSLRELLAGAKETQPVHHHCRVFVTMKHWCRGALHSLSLRFADQASRVTIQCDKQVMLCDPATNLFTTAPLELTVCEGQAWVGCIANEVGPMQLRITSDTSEDTVTVAVHDVQGYLQLSPDDLRMPGTVLSSETVSPQKDSPVSVTPVKLRNFITVCCKDVSVNVPVGVDSQCTTADIETHLKSSLTRLQDQNGVLVTKFIEGQTYCVAGQEVYKETAERMPRMLQKGIDCQRRLWQKHFSTLFDPLSGEIPDSWSEGFHRHDGYDTTELGAQRPKRVHKANDVCIALAPYKCSAHDDIVKCAKSFRNVVVLGDEECVEASVRLVLQGLYAAFKNSTREFTIWVHFSGLSGVVNGEQVLYLYDSFCGERECVLIRVFEELAMSLPSLVRVVVVLDTSREDGDIEVRHEPLGLPQREDHGALQVFYACREGQAAWMKGPCGSLSQVLYDDDFWATSWMLSVVEKRVSMSQVMSSCAVLVEKSMWELESKRQYPELIGMRLDGLLSTPLDGSDLLRSRKNFIPYEERGLRLAGGAVHGVCPGEVYDLVLPKSARRKDVPLELITMFIGGGSSLVKIRVRKDYVHLLQHPLKSSELMGMYALGRDGTKVVGEGRGWCRSNELVLGDVWERMPELMQEVVVFEGVVEELKETAERYARWAAMVGAGEAHPVREWCDMVAVVGGSTYRQGDEPTVATVHGGKISIDVHFEAPPLQLCYACDGAPTWFLSVIVYFKNGATKLLASTPCSASCPSAKGDVTIPIDNNFASYTLLRVVLSPESLYYLDHPPVTLCCSSPDTQCPPKAARITAALRTCAMGLTPPKVSLKPWATWDIFVK